ncbi:MAG: hypothetical protein HBSAPP03_08130 [Phycisphaerae bacterium]|nr:MAG: hypothetical protein HBSAPP03_08130 [Phycisphaerae bacterium]
MAAGWWLHVGVPAASGQSTPVPKAPDPVLSREGGILRWDEGLPLGNGLLGVLVWGDAGTLRLSLDRADLWDTRLPDIFRVPGWTYATMIALKEARNHAEHQRLFDVPYDTIPYPTKLPVGRLEITLPSGETLTDFRLHLVDGTANVGVRHDPRSFGSMDVAVAGEPTVVVTRVPAGASLRLVPPGGVKALGYAPAEEGADADGVWFVQRTLGEVAYAVAACLRESRPPNRGQPIIRAVAVSVASNADGPDPLTIARVRAKAAADVYAAGNGVRDETMRHRAAVRDASVSIPDAALQVHYDLCRHLMVSGSRPDAPPMALQGVWTADEGGLPPWKGDYHNDLNTQTTYLAHHAAGLNEQGGSWLNFNWNLLPRYRAFAREFYGLPESSPPPAVVPGVMALDGAPMGGWGQYSLSPTHSAWVAQSFYLHWRYTMDRAFLRERARPFCESVAAAMEALAPPDEHGRRRLPLSTSPEIHDNSYAAWLPPNSNYDLAMLRFIFAACAEMAREDGDAKGEVRWRGALAACEPFDADDTGLTFARGHPYDQSHRHFSHAMAIHPLGLMTLEGTDTDRATIRATLARLESMGTAWWTGYSFAWAACLFARADEPEKALDFLTTYLAFTGPNGFHLNGDQSGKGHSKFTYRPFTLEGNFLAMQALQEMLLQSWGEVGAPGTSIVRVFPAVSPRWPVASFTNLRAEGGFRVSAVRRGGVTTDVSIVADAGGELRLRDPFAGREATWSRAVKREGNVVTCVLSSGETLHGKAATP